MQDTSNIKKYILAGILIIVCVAILFFLFNLFETANPLGSLNVTPTLNSTSLEVPKPIDRNFEPTQSSTTLETEANLIEDKNVTEFSSANNTYTKQEEDTYTQATAVTNDTNKVLLASNGDLTDKNNLEKLLSATNDLIKKYPEEAHFYVMRVWYSLALGHTNYSDIHADLDTAEKLAYYDDNGGGLTKPYRLAVYPSTIYLLRAKVSSLTGDRESEINYLLNSVTLRLHEHKGVAVFPTYFILFQETKRNKYDLPLSYFDELVKSSPNDFRTYLLRGIYYGSNIDTQTPSSVKKYFPLALTDFNKAFKINPKSPDVSYFLANLYMTKMITSYNSTNKQSLLQYAKQAVFLDPKNEYAYLLLGFANLNLENNEEGIKNFGKVIELDSSNQIAYVFRSMAEDSLNTFSPYSDHVISDNELKIEEQAISDISMAIQIEEASPFYEFYNKPLFELYSDRASYYFKIREGLRAAKDYDKVISAVFAKQMLLMDIKTIRSIYPEFAGISDEDLLEGLRQKYYPFTYDKKSFYDAIMANKTDRRIVKNKEDVNDNMDQFSLSFYYQQRAEAYYNSNDTYKASADYKRMVHNSAAFPVDQIRLTRMNQIQ